MLAHDDLPPIGTQLVVDTDEAILLGDVKNGSSADNNSCLTFWGILRRKGSETEEIKLEYRIKDGNRDSYVLGRSESLCDIVIEDEKRRISSQHCKVYVDYNQPTKVKIFLENMSINGTYINNHQTRISQGERMELRSGDEVFLISPRNTEANQSFSFVFINVRDRLVANRERSVVPVTSPPQQSMNPYLRLLPQSNAANGAANQRSFTDHYILGDLLGSGMSGEVFLCIQRQTLRKCAVKILDMRKLLLGNQHTNIQEILSEAKIMQQLSHPHIIAIYDVFQSVHTVHIVMELVTGGDLFDRIVARTRYPEAKARLVMHQILQAIQYLHGKDILHRDLKPENVLLVSGEEDSGIKVTDFGLAKQLSNSSEGLKTFCGTPQYFAPEVLRRQHTVCGVGRYGKAVDMWSAGVLLFVLLAGAFPFDDNCLTEQIEQASYSFTGEVWQDVSSEAKQFIASLLMVQPEDRLTATQALQHPWFASLSSSSSSSTVGAKKKKMSTVTLPALSFATKPPQPPIITPSTTHIVTSTTPVIAKKPDKEEAVSTLSKEKEKQLQTKEEWKFSDLGPIYCDSNNSNNNNNNSNNTAAVAKEEELSEDNIELYSTDSDSDDHKEEEEEKGKDKDKEKKKGKKVRDKKRKPRSNDKDNNRNNKQQKKKKNVTFATTTNSSCDAKRQLSLDMIWQPHKKPADRDHGSPDTHEVFIQLRSPVNMLSRVFQQQPSHSNSNNSNSS